MAHFHVYDALVRSHPNTQWMFFWENKPFEHALTSAVQRHDEAHKAPGTDNRSATSTTTRTVGYARLVVRRRDHRYFEEWGSSPRQPHQRPVASVYAGDGPLAHRNLGDIALPGAPVVEVEALRYSSLVTVTQREPARLLVLGDISEYESRRLLEATSQALASITAQARPAVEPWFKPHPGSPSHAEIARSHGFAVTDEHLSALAPSLALAVVGVAGAASIDLTLLEVPTATVLDACSMNLSPLVGVAGACFVRSAIELRDVIMAPQLHGLAEIDLMNHPSLQFAGCASSRCCRDCKHSRRTGRDWRDSRRCGARSRRRSDQSLLPRTHRLVRDLPRRIDADRAPPRRPTLARRAHADHHRQRRTTL
jgi:surface carbohydrate biosynthesis protein (TIGR04326 family)